ncbi:MAG: hypothetical protein QXK37_05385 [Candidatus Woesearchaeota archaeon]
MAKDNDKDNLNAVEPLNAVNLAQKQSIDFHCLNSLKILNDIDKIINANIYNAERETKPKKRLEYLVNAFNRCKSAQIMIEQIPNLGDYWQRHFQIKYQEKEMQLERMISLLKKNIHDEEIYKAELAKPSLVVDYKKQEYTLSDLRLARGYAFMCMQLANSSVGEQKLKYLNLIVENCKRGHFMLLSRSVSPEQYKTYYTFFNVAMVKALEKIEIYSIRIGNKKGIEDSPGLQRHYKNTVH